MSKLKPCPFCGGEVSLVTSKIWDIYDYKPTYCVQCSCGVFTRAVDTDGEAMRMWNRRVEK